MDRGYQKFASDDIAGCKPHLVELALADAIPVEDDAQRLDPGVDVEGAQQVHDHAPVGGVEEVLDDLLPVLLGAHQARILAHKRPVLAGHHRRNGAARLLPGVRVRHVRAKHNGRQVRDERQALAHLLRQQRVAATNLERREGERSGEGNEYRCTD